jgi:hypothetical protein
MASRAPMLEGASVTLNVRDGPKTLQVAARARDKPEGPVLVWNFADDERGSAARDAALKATARGDCEVVVESGCDVQLANAPRPLRETLQQTKPGELRGRLAFTPGPGIPLSITAYDKSSNSTSRTSSSTRSPRPRGTRSASTTVLTSAWTGHSCPISRFASTMNATLNSRRCAARRP